MPLTLASNAITFTDNTSLSSGVLGPAQLSAAAVTTPKIAANAVTLDKLTQSSGPFTLRNRIINGGLDIWQREVTFTLAPTGARHTADRWRGDFANGRGTATITRQQFDYNIGLPAGIVTKNYIRYTTSSDFALSATTGFSQFAFHNENVKNFYGKTFTISFWARASQPNAVVGLHFNSNFGTGGSSPGFARHPNATLQHIPLTTNWTKIVHTFSVPLSSGITYGPDNTSTFNFGINFGTRGNHTVDAVYNTDIIPVPNCNYDFAQLQLEEGTVATPFEERPISIELALCQRYYCKSYQLDQFPGYAEHDQGVGFLGQEILSDYNTVARNFGGYAPFPVEMRAVPTIRLYEVNGGVLGRVSYPNLADSNIWRGGMTASRANTRGFCEITGSPLSISGAWPAHGAAANFQYTAEAELGI